MNNILAKEQVDTINSFCRQHVSGKQIINSDGTVDVDGDFFYNSNSGLKGYTENNEIELPFQFNRISGDFRIAGINLKSLKGSPKYVGGDFRCGSCGLTSLEYAPLEIDGDFSCSNNKLSSFIHSPKKIGGNFDGFSNEFRSLDHFPLNVGDSIDLDYNGFPYQFYLLLKGLPKDAIKTVIKYHEYYEVWNPEFNLENYEILIQEIKDGLK